MGRRPGGRGDALRMTIAQEAARLIAEHGIHDYGLAKRKAAERLGVDTDCAVLPRNVEVEAALMERQRLFGGNSHGDNLQRLRGTAVQAMELLCHFEPRLVGPVLIGTATEYDDIQLHLFADSVEQVVMFLLDRRVAYELIQRRLRLQSDRDAVTLPGLRFDIAGQAIEALVFSKDGIRQAPVSPVDGKPMRRASLAEVDALD